MKERTVHQIENYDPDWDLYPNHFNDYGNRDQGHDLADAIIMERGDLKRVSNYRSNKNIESKVNPEEIVFKENIKPQECYALKEIFDENFLKTTYAASSLDYVEDIKDTLKKIESTGLVSFPDYDNFGTRNLMVLYSTVKNHIKPLLND